MFRRAVLVAGACTVVIMGCSSDDQPSTVGTASSVTATTAAATNASGSSSTTTTVTVPQAPAPSAQEAAATFVNAWRDGNQLLALTIADQKAVDAVFAAGAPGRIQSRGCNAPVQPESPVLCVYRTDAGEVQVRIQPRPDGWIVDQAIVSTG
jgi:hypothetical protein